MSRKKRKQHSEQASIVSPYFTMTLPVVEGCTDYTIEGIAPIPVRVGLHERVRIEPTTDGYNIYEVGK